MNTSRRTRMHPPQGGPIAPLLAGWSIALYLQREKIAF